MIDLAHPDLHLVIRGVPATAGSKTAWPFQRRDGTLGVRVAKGRNTNDERKKQAWRDAVVAAVVDEWRHRSAANLYQRIRTRPYNSSTRTGSDHLEYIGPVLDGPLFCWADFYLPRPKTVKREWPTGPPDVDKLARSLDPLVTPHKSVPGLIADDSRIVGLWAVKRYADDHESGAEVRIWRVASAPSSLMAEMLAVARSTG